MPRTAFAPPSPTAPRPPSPTAPAARRTSVSPSIVVARKPSPPSTSAPTPVSSPAKASSAPARPRQRRPPPPPPPQPAPSPAPNRSTPPPWPPHPSSPPGPARASPNGLAGWSSFNSAVLLSSRAEQSHKPQHHNQRIAQACPSEAGRQANTVWNLQASLRLFIFASVVHFSVESAQPEQDRPVYAITLLQEGAKPRARHARPPRKPPPLTPPRSLPTLRLGEP